MFITDFIIKTDFVLLGIALSLLSALPKVFSETVALSQSIFVFEDELL